MKIDVTDISKEIYYNARDGKQTLKVIEVVEELDDTRQEYLIITFVNQWGEYHREKFDPTRHSKKLYELACAFGDAIYKEGSDVVVETSDFVGNYFSAILRPVELKDGGISDALFIRDIRVSPKRKDTTGSRLFTNRRPRRTKK